MRLTVIFTLSLAFVGHARAELPNTVESATRRGLARVKQAASDWQKHKTCFSCHHQTLPMLAALEAAHAGFPLDKEWLKSQADTTHEYFAGRIEDMDEGDHVPGGAATTAYGFWALSLDQRPADPATTAMVNYLLQIQGVQRLKPVKVSESAQPRDGRWIASCRRPPLQGSEIGDTVLVLLGLEQYAMPEQRPRLAAARADAEKFLTQAKLRNQQDHLWRLWGLHQLGGDAAVMEKALTAILAAQRDDGGWSETNERESDAYSTGQTLFMLLKTGSARNARAVLRARDYLLRTQHADGSWLAESHVKNKAQPYFENGDPHGVNQFLSTAATAWATAALAQLLPAKN